MEAKPGGTGGKKKPSETANGRGCRYCGKDHWNHECESEKAVEARKKWQTRTIQEKEGKEKVNRGYQLMAEMEEEMLGSDFSVLGEDSASDIEPSDNYLSCSSFLSRRAFPFNYSRMVPLDEVVISPLPRRDLVGTGLDFTSATPLPVEVFISKEGSSKPENPNTFRVCVDTGGQGLIDKNWLKICVPNAKLYTHEPDSKGNLPNFIGIGGARSQAANYVVLEVFFPNQELLEGGKQEREKRLTQISIEFQLVEDLGCNALIGREVLGHHGVQILEDQEVLRFPNQNTTPIINFATDPRASRHTPRLLYAKTGRYLKPGQEAVVEIRNPGLTGDVTLTVDPIHFDRRSRFTGTLFPRAVIRGDQQFVTIRNLMRYPIRIAKGEPIGRVSAERVVSCQKLEVAEWEKVVPGLAKLAGNRKKGKRAAECLVDLILALREEEVLEPDAYHELISELSKIHKLTVDQVGVGAPADEDRSPRTKHTRQEEFANPACHGMSPNPIEIQVNTHPTSSQKRHINSPAHEQPLRAEVQGSRVLISGHALTLNYQIGGEATTVTADQLGLDDEFPDVERDSVKLKVAEELRPPHSNPADDSPLDEISFQINPKVDQQAIMEVLKKHLSAFGFQGRRLGALATEMTIDATSMPPSQPPYRESPRVKGIIAASMKTLLDHDIIEPSESPTASPVVVVKQHGKHRFCVDFRRLNDFTAPIRYPLPRPDSIFNALSGKRYFSTMDANKGYHQFMVDKKSRHLTAFVTESQGLWQYKRVPFGLKNAPSFFQAAMDAILGSMRWDFVLAYIDDLIIYSNSFTNHLHHLDAVLKSIGAVGMTLDERKCFFGYERLSLLGHRISRLGLMTQPEKVKAIQSMPFPRTVKGLQTVLGQFTYYRQFIPKFALIAQPLFDALKLTESLPDETPKEHAKRHGRQLVTETPETAQAL